MPFDLTETAAKNPFADPAAMNLSDVKAKVAAAPDLPERAKSEMISALNSTALWQHQTLEELPANNALYVGRLEWNRCSYVKDPRTGKRVARPNPQEKWEVIEVPRLRIVDDALWARVKARQQDVRIEIGRDLGGNALNRLHRRRFLLSGLLVCGSCGGSYTIVGLDRYGCATRRAKGTCANALVIGRHEIEERVLGGLKERMLEPDLVSTFVEAFNEEFRRHARTADAERTSTKRTLADVERKLSGIVRAIEDGAYNATLKSRLTVLETEKAELERKLAGLKAAPVMRLHSNLAELYRSKVATLVDALNEPDAVSEAGDILRSLIERIVLTPVEGVQRADAQSLFFKVVAKNSGPVPAAVNRREDSPPRPSR